MGFDYVRPSTVAEAVRLLGEGGDAARPISGGQSLMPMVNLGLASPTLLVDLWGMPELSLITVHPDRLEIGAATTHARLLASEAVATHAPLLQSAAGHIGSPRIRNRGTIGGSLSHGDPVAELPLACWALGARYTVTGPQGSRTVPAEEFSQGHYTTALEEGEILTGITVPRETGGSAFLEHSRRAGDFALAAVAAFISVDGGHVRHCRIAVAGARDRPQRLHALESILSGAEVGRVTELIPTRLPEVEPHDDAYVPAAYRARLLRALTKRAVVAAISNHAGRDQ